MWFLSRSKDLVLLYVATNALYIYIYGCFVSIVYHMCKVFDNCSEYLCDNNVLNFIHSCVVRNLRTRLMELTSA